MGDYYVNRAPASLVEIMDVDGNAIVLEVTAPLDSRWQSLTKPQSYSYVWKARQEGR